MKKNIKKKYLLATAVVMTISATVGMVMENPTDIEASTAVKLSEKKQGDIIKLGEKQYRVISQKYGGVMVQDLNTISSAFDTDNTNIFNPNDSNNIGYYLNNTYYNSLTADAKSAIKTVDWHIGNELNESEKIVSAKVGLLTRSDWMTVGESFGGKIPKIGNNHEWLLTTPEYSYITSHIYMIGMSMGNVSYDYTTTVGIALARPVLVLDSNLLVDSNNVVQTNQTPTNKTTIPTQTIANKGATKTVNLANYFQDLDGDALTYTVSSNATNKVTASVSGSTLTLTGQSKGSASITVTAKDPSGASVSQTFTTTVKNTSPTLTTNFNKLNLRPGEVSSVIVLTGIDEDGDNLSYVVTSSNYDVAKVTVSGNQLIVQGLQEGSANIMVKVTDGETDSGLTGSMKTFTVDVAQPSPIAPSEPVDVDNNGGLTNGTVNLGDIFDDENPSDLIFTPNILVNEPQADIFIQNQLLVIENPKQKGIISVEVEATNIYGKTATAVLNMTIDESDVVTNPETGSSKGKDSKVTLRLVEGEFTLKTDNITSFGTVKLTAAKQTVTTDFAGDFGVIDARGTQEGWDVTVSATPFTVETFDGFVGTPHQLPIGSLALNSVTGIERLNHVNQTDGLPSSLMQTATVIDTNNALSILNANQGEGLGEFKFNFGTDALALTVDAVTAKIDKVNYPDSNTPYTSTVTWNLVSGPQI